MSLTKPDVADQPAVPAGEESLRTMSWSRLRDLFALAPDAIHLNTGTIGVMPHAVLDTQDQVTREWTGSLMDVYPPGMYPEHRAAIGRSYGVDQDEMVISHNATEGVARIIHGLDLHEGDEVITTSHECYSVLSNFNLLRNRHGIKLTVLTLPTGYDVRAEDIVARFEEAITPQTKVLSFFGISLFTGTMMPIRALSELAHRHGLITVVDGALLPGLLDCDMRALGVDFIAGSGSKFQCGPLGTGLLYVRNKVHPEHNPLPLPTFWPIISTWYPMLGAQPPRTRTSVESDNMGDYLQSAGSASIARGAALAKACAMWDEIGRDRIERRAMELGDYARARIAEQWGLEAMFSPGADRSLRSPLVAFRPFRRPEDAWSVRKIHSYTTRLAEEHRIWVRWTEFDLPDSSHQHYAARLAPHIYNDTDEIDEAITVMARLAEDMS